MPNPIGDLLLEALGKSGITQAQLAKRTGYSPSIISQIICGRKRLKLDYAVKIYQHCKRFEFWKAIDIVIAEDFERKNLKPPKR